MGIVKDSDGNWIHKSSKDTFEFHQDPYLRTQFFLGFNKAFTKQSAIKTVYKGGKKTYNSFSTNVSPTADHYFKDFQKAIEQGSIKSEDSIYTENKEFNKENLDKIAKDVDSLEKVIEKAEKSNLADRNKAI